MTMAATSTYRCSRCGKVEEKGQGWQAVAMFVDSNLRPRLYDLCTECTEKVARFLEGDE